MEEEGYCELGASDWPSYAGLYGGHDLPEAINSGAKRGSVRGGEETRLHRS